MGIYVKSVSTFGLNKDSEVQEKIYISIIYYHAQGLALKLLFYQEKFERRVMGW
jgi:hypothetical protein